MKSKGKITLKFFTGTVIGLLLMITAGCSSHTEEEEKAYESIREYQEELYSDSNETLEIEYPELKDIDDDNIIEGKSQHENDTLKIKGTYTYNPEKVQTSDSDEEHNGNTEENNFEAVVEMYDDKYKVINYDEEKDIRLTLDDDSYFD